MQKWFTIIALAAVFLLCLIGIWIEGAAPYICPVPTALLSQPGQVPCFEFWFSRYQGLIAAAAAIGVAVYATAPAWRQVGIMERQAVVSTRERLAARYKMIDDIMDIAGWDVLFFGHGPQNHYKSEEQFQESKERLLSYYAARKGKFTEMARGLAAYPFSQDDRAIIDAAVANMEARFLQCDQGIAEAISKDTSTEDSRRDAASLLWFYCVEHVTTMLQSQVRAIGSITVQTKAGLVLDLVNPPKEI